MNKRIGIAGVTLAAVAALTTGCASSGVDGGGSLPPGVSLPGSPTSSTSQPSTSQPSTSQPSTSQPSTPTAISGTSSAPSVPSPAQTIVSSRPGIFVGTWSGHGREMVIRSSGTGSVGYRIYTFCGAGVPKPCDQMQGNNIIDGGRATFTVDKVVTAHHRSTATITITSSTDPKVAAAGSTQQLELDGDVITSPWSTLCDTKGSQAGDCGA